MQQRSVVTVGFLLVGISLLLCCASAVTVAVIPFTVYPEQNGDSAGHDVPYEFSMLCYGHSFRSVDYWNTVYLNATTDNPVPLNQVLDLHVHCPSARICTAQSDYRGDPEKSEWCVLNTSGHIPFANISKENLRINCSGTEIEWDFLRCQKEAEIIYPCENYYGSHKYHCLDARNEEFIKCRASFYSSRNQSSLPDSGCEIHFNMTQDNTAISAHVAPTVVTAGSFRSPGSLWCAIPTLIGGKC